MVRTTIEIKPEHRSSLLALAATRGEKGFSGVLAEAIESYLRGEEEREKRLRNFLQLAGSLPDEDAGQLRRTVQELRESWR
jgi:hypothetical protein